MKGSLTTKLVTVLLFVAVLIYFCVQGWNYFTRPETVSNVYTYRAENVLKMEGWVVRDEEVVPCSETLLEIRRTEGERVAKGKTIATVYRDADALRAEQEVSLLRTQLEQLQYAQSAARDTETALRLDTDIERGLIDVRAALESGNYAALDSDVSSLKTIVLRREYSFHGSADLSGRIAELEAQLAAAKKAAGSVSRMITAPFSGTYSSIVDGYEAVLTPESLETLTPAALSQLKPENVRSTVGKLVRGSRWYFAAAVSAEEAAGIVRGKSYHLDIANLSASLPVTASSVGREQDGKCLVVFRSNEYLSSVTTLRAESAELILESYEGLRVPKNALRIDETGNTGVYCRIGRSAYFKPVQVIYQGEDYCLVLPGEIDVNRESDRILYTIRAGDEAITTAGNLYNGKVIE